MLHEYAFPVVFFSYILSIIVFNIPYILSIIVFNLPHILSTDGRILFDQLQVNTEWEGEETKKNNLER